MSGIFTLNPIAFLLSLSILLFTGCSKYDSNQQTYSEEDEIVEQVVTSEAYNNFLLEFEKENTGIDIKPVFDAFIENKVEITEINYEIKKCNLSRYDVLYQDDIIINIDVKYDWYKLNTIITHVCIKDENNSLQPVFSEAHRFANYELIDVLNNGKNQFLFTTDDSGNHQTFMPIKILSFDTNSQKMEIIFDEILCAYAYLPIKMNTDDEFYTISFDNKYEFVPNKNGKSDILFTSEIFEREDEVLLRGESRFVFDGEKFVTNNYYDYRQIAKQLYDN